MPSAMKEEYRLAARRIAELRLLGQNPLAREIAEELGMDIKKFQRVYSQKYFKKAIEKEVEYLKQMPERVGSTTNILILEENERSLNDFAKRNIHEFIKAFQTLVELRDSGESKDEIRRKAAVNIIEFFLSMAHRNKASMEARIRTKLPDELRKEIELIFKKEEQNVKSEQL